MPYALPAGPSCDIFAPAAQTKTAFRSMRNAVFSGRLFLACELFRRNEAYFLASSAGAPFTLPTTFSMVSFTSSAGDFRSSFFSSFESAPLYPYFVFVFFSLSSGLKPQLESFRSDVLSTPGVIVKLVAGMSATARLMKSRQSLPVGAARQPLQVAVEIVADPNCGGDIRRVADEPGIFRVIRIPVLPAIGRPM